MANSFLMFSYSVKTVVFRRGYLATHETDFEFTGHSCCSGKAGQSPEKLILLKQKLLNPTKTLLLSVIYIFPKTPNSLCNLLPDKP